MTRVDRAELLKILESVTPGLAAREIIEQSSCFAFHDGKVMTFNDECCCSNDTPLKIEGAVKADPLLKLLSKLTEDEIQIKQAETEGGGKELRIKGNKRRTRFRMEQEVTLPVDTVEIPEEWRELDPEFTEAVNVVHGCASNEESQFMLTCIHIHPDYLEACDRFQIARYPVKTGVEVGDEESILVRAESLKKIVGYDMTQVAETESWIHFKNPAGLVLSCRRYLDQYSDLSPFLSDEGITPITLPGGLDEIVDRARIFSAENATGDDVLVELKPGRIKIQGEGSQGSYEEIKDVKFDGDPIKFLIAPKLLVEITKKSNECGVGERRLFIDTGKFRYVTATSSPDSEKE